MRTLFSWAKSRKWTIAGPPAVSAGIESGSAPIHSRPAGRSGAAMLSRLGAHPRTLSWRAAPMSFLTLALRPRAGRQAGPADPRLALRLGGLDRPRRLLLRPLRRLAQAAVRGGTLAPLGRLAHAPSCAPGRSRSSAAASASSSSASASTPASTAPKRPIATSRSPSSSSPPGSASRSSRRSSATSSRPSTRGGRSPGSRGGAYRLVARRRPRHLAYPERLGRWPAAVGLLAFVWLEVVYGSSGGVAVGLEPHAAGRRRLRLHRLHAGDDGPLRRRGVVRARRDLLGLLRDVLPARPVRGQGRSHRPPPPARRRDPLGDERPRLDRGGDRLDRHDQLRRGRGRRLQSGRSNTSASWIEGVGFGPLATIRITDSIFMAATVAAVAAVYLLGVKGMRSVPGAPAFKELVSAASPTP